MPLREYHRLLTEARAIAERHRCVQFEEALDVDPAFPADAEVLEDGLAARDRGPVREERAPADATPEQPQNLCAKAIRVLWRQRSQSEA
jgi:hypothetical protein